MTKEKSRRISIAWAARSVLVLVVLGVFLMLGLQAIKRHVAEDIYRQRLSALQADYTHLVGQYNEAITRTAVTELLVEDGTLSVIIRTAQGLDKTIKTPYDPREEIYVDYVLIDGRLWIRRVFDAKTPASDGLVIDPTYGAIDWEQRGAKHGKAVYRRLTEGRWSVTVSGDGSLALAPIAEGAEHLLSPAPPIRDYEPLDESVQKRLDEISLLEAVKSLF